jgi:hypothetical protein
VRGGYSLGLQGAENLPPRLQTTESCQKSGNFIVLPSAGPLRETTPQMQRTSASARGLRVASIPPGWSISSSIVGAV